MMMGWPFIYIYLYNFYTMLPCFLEINGCFKGRIPQIYWTNKFNQIWGFEEQTMVNRVTAWRDSLAQHRYMGMRGWTRHVWSFSWYQFVSGMCQSRYCLMNQQRIVRVQSLICCSAWSGAWRSAVCFLQMNSKGAFYKRSFQPTDLASKSWWITCGVYFSQLWNISHFNLVMTNIAMENPPIFNR